MKIRKTEALWMAIAAGLWGMVLYRKLRAKQAAAPVASSSAVTAARTATRISLPRPASGGTYTVQEGDSLSKIARDVMGDMNRWPEIADANGISDPYVIYPGQVLTLPA